MLLGAVASGVVCALLALVLRRRVDGVTALALAGLLWTLVVIGLVTLLPTDAPGVVFAEDRLATCSWDIGGPAPDGFWIFPGGQRLLNTAVFVPAGAFLALAATRWPRRAWVGVPVGLVLLVAYSVGIEVTQLELARLDRACDVTDIIQLRRRRDRCRAGAGGGCGAAALASALRVR